MNYLKQPNYAAWSWDYKNFPKNKNMEEKIKFFLEAGILAANIHNTQPWLFEIQNDTLKILPNLKRRLLYGDPHIRNLYISLGCCLRNIECIAGYYQYSTNIEIKKIKQKHYTIVIKFLPAKKIDINLSLQAPFINKRFSNKLPYQKKSIQSEIKKKLLDYNIDKNIKIAFFEDITLIDKTAQLQEKSVLKTASDSRFRRELSNWLRTNNTLAEDGMPGFVVGFKPLQTIIGKKLMPYTPFLFNIMAKKDKKLLKNSALIGTIFSKGMDIDSWINSGRLYEELCLRATSLGINIAPMHAMVEDEQIYPKLMKLFNLDGMRPHMFFRLGYSTIESYHTPRRNIKKSLLFTMDSETKLQNTIQVKTEIHQIKINKYSINYITAGSGKSLILIHGGNIGWGQWYPNIEVLSHYFKVYAIDLPGGGRSTPVDFSKVDLEKDMADILAKFITKLNVKNPTVLGSSIGGWIAVKLALRSDIIIDKLVVVDSFGFSDYLDIKNKIIGIYPLAYLISKTLLKATEKNKNLEGFLRDVFYKKDFPIRQEFIDYFYETTKSSHNLLFISRLSKMQANGELLLSEELKNIKNKTLIIWGEDDKLIPIKQNSPFFSLIPNAKVHIIKQAGHIPSIERGEEFNRTVIDFINKA